MTKPEQTANVEPVSSNGGLSCEHDWTWVDDSFDHEFGTEFCGHWECEECGAVDEEREPPEYELFGDEVI